MSGVLFSDSRSALQLLSVTTKNYRQIHNHDYRISK